MKFAFTLMMAVVIASFTTPDANALGRLRQNTHLIQANPDNGFAIYRVSEPNETDMKNFCALGITEMMVLSGTGEIDERLAKEHCPTLRVIYNVKSSAKIPLSEEFLAYFDAWVQDAQATGKKIAFRCNCGCHRTGRLAAYYQMKYQGLGAKEANAIMRKLGKYMIFFPFLDNQVRALHDYIHNRPCSEKQKHCVRKTEPTFHEVERAMSEGFDEDFGAAGPAQMQ